MCVCVKVGISCPNTSLIHSVSLLAVRFLSISNPAWLGSAILQLHYDVWSEPPLHQGSQVFRPRLGHNVVYLSAASLPALPHRPHRALGQKAAICSPAAAMSEAKDLRARAVASRHLYVHLYRSGWLCASALYTGERHV